MRSVALDLTEPLTVTVDGGYERVFGPTFERYDSDDDSMSRDGTVKLYAPVDEGRAGRPFPLHEFQGKPGAL